MPKMGKLATQRETYEERESDEERSESEGDPDSAIGCNPKESKKGAMLVKEADYQKKMIKEEDSDCGSYKPVPSKEYTGARGSLLLNK